mmetsp:Transcript_55259/g.87637  ORF Transcript_55259/g.87637 Transcript_55259/m.87637 type:complete len:111 (-) Transcript_55259:161-493(-)
MHCTANLHRRVVADSTGDSKASVGQLMDAGFQVVGQDAEEFFFQAKVLVLLAHRSPIPLPRIHARVSMVAQISPNLGEYRCMADCFPQLVERLMEAERIQLVSLALAGAR